MLEKGNILSNYFSGLGKKNTGKDRAFSLVNLQKGIDFVLETKAKVTNSDLRAYFKMNPATFRKHLKALNLDKGKLDSAMRGETRLV